MTGDNLKHLFSLFLSQYSFQLVRSWATAQSRWREPKELILNRSEILSITCFSLLIITLNLRKTQEGKWSKNQVVRDWHSRTTWFFDSRFLLPSWGSQIKERLIRECQSRIPPQADSFVWRSPRFLVLG